MKERVVMVMNEKANSAASFAKEIGVKQTTFNNYVRGIRPVATDVIQSILSKYVDISAEWLLLGKGDMHKSTGSNNQPELGESGKYMKFLEDKIKWLQEKNAILQGRIDDKDKLIEFYESLLHESHEDYIEEKNKK